MRNTTRKATMPKLFRVTDNRRLKLYHWYTQTVRKVNACNYAIQKRIYDVLRGMVTGRTPDDPRRTTTLTAMRINKNANTLNRQ
jgi:hypothetical protein